MASLASLASEDPGAVDLGWGFPAGVSLSFTYSGWGWGYKDVKIFKMQFFLSVHERFVTWWCFGSFI